MLTIETFIDSEIDQFVCNGELVSFVCNYLSAIYVIFFSCIIIIIITSRTAICTCDVLRTLSSVDGYVGYLQASVKTNESCLTCRHDNK